MLFSNRSLGRTAKPLFVSSILTAASNLFNYSPAISWFVRTGDVVGNVVDICSVRAIAIHSAVTRFSCVYLLFPSRSSLEAVCPQQLTTWLSTRLTPNRANSGVTSPKNGRLYVKRGADPSDTSSPQAQRKSSVIVASKVWNSLTLML